MPTPQAYKTYKLGGTISELLYSPATYGIDLDAKDMLKPRARAAPMLCVLRNTLWLLGGQVEIAHTDIVLGGCGGAGCGWVGWVRMGAGNNVRTPGGSCSPPRSARLRSSPGCCHH